MTAIAPPRPDSTEPDSTEPESTRPDPAGRPPKPRGWFGPLLLRLHFYAGIFAGPFILVAALSGALYALTPQLDQIVYSHELTAPITATTVPLADQVDAAQAVVGDTGSLVAVRPAPEPGATTRVMFTADGLGEGETRAIFVDPGTASVRGDLVAYGTSGALPLRSWLSQLHRNLQLGDVGRIYSELAASWLGVTALAGLGLWVVRLRKTRAKRDLLRPNLRATGYRRLLSLHSATGAWLLLIALFLSATGITWSQYAGQNVSDLRAAVNLGTPAVATDLAAAGETTVGAGASAGPAAADPHAGHGGAAAAAAAAAAGVDPATFDAVLHVAQGVNVNTGRVEIRPPAADGQAWVVQEIQRSFPTEVDAVAVSGATLAVIDRVDFSEFNLAAKLARWGIDTHSGSMFGLANQIVLFVAAIGIAGLVVLGYLMWFKRRPPRQPGRRLGSVPTAGALTRAPWWGLLAVLAGAIVLGLFLPLLGISLLGFILVDGLLSLRSPRPVPAR